MLINTDGLHSFPQIENDIITWELYGNIYVQASISEYDTIIDIIHKNTLHGSYMHWHPDIEEMYEELINELNEVLARDPEHADALYTLGVAYAGYKEDAEKALECFTKALEAQADHILAANGKKIMEQALSGE